MGIFDYRKIKLLKEKIELIKNKAQEEGRFSLFHAKFAENIVEKANKYDALETYFDVISEHDEKCKIPYEVGMKLDELSDNEDVFIHRTRLYLEEVETSKKIMTDMMENGLSNYGHANAVGGTGYLINIPPLTLTMSPIAGLEGYINLVSSYKNNNLIVIASFPKGLVNEEGEAINDYNDIYNMDEGVPRVKPEFMKGIIIKNNEGLWQYKSKEEILKEKEEGKAM